MTSTERAEREERWLHRGMVVIGVLIVLLLLTTIVGLTISVSNRTASAERAAAQLEELRVIAERLDRQATELEDNAAAAQQSREQFELAITLLLDALEVEDDPFADQAAGGSQEPDPEGRDPPRDNPSPSPEPSPSPSPPPEDDPPPEDPDDDPPEDQDPVQELVDDLRP